MKARAIRPAPCCALPARPTPARATTPGRSTGRRAAPAEPPFAAPPSRDRMPYAERNEDGIVVALFAEQNERAHEFLTSNHPEIAVFLADGGGAVQHAR